MNVYGLAGFVLLAVLAVQVARLVWAVATPVGPLGDWRVNAPGASGSPVAILRGFDPFFRSGEVAAGEGSITSLQLKLFGTRIDDASGLGSAIIAGPDGIQKSIAVGEEIVPGAVLKSVAFDHVSIDHGGSVEDLYIDQSGAAGSAPDVAPPPAGEPSAPPDDVAPRTGTAGSSIAVEQIRSDVAFIPRIDGGRVTGLAVRPQGTGGTFAAMGLKEGDVITQIGGRAIGSPSDLDRVVAGLAPGTNLSLTVERGAQTLPIAVSIRGK